MGQASLGYNDMGIFMWIELYCTDFSRKRFNLMASVTVLFVLVGFVVNKFGLVLSTLSVFVDVESWLTSISGVRYSGSSFNHLTGLWFDISPSF